MNYLTSMDSVLEKIEKGAFLTVKNGSRINTMTIGWATFGIIWRKPILMVAVRPTRYTFSIIETADNFTMSVPSADMSKELEFCGTKSGRDFDKIKECGLKTLKAKKVGSLVIGVPGDHFECRIVFKTAMTPEKLVKEYEYLYPHRDFHTLYFGEIADRYEIN